MAYDLFDNTVPNTSNTGAELPDVTLKNLVALRDAVVAGAMAGWDMSTSGGTASEPATILYSKGTLRVRLSLTWNSTNVTQIVYDYSSDGGTNYSQIGTEAINYDANDNVTSTTWTLP